MASASSPVQRSRYGYHVLIAVTLSVLYLAAIWAARSYSAVFALLPWLGFLMPVALGLSLIVFLFVGAYGLLSFVLGLSFYVQGGTFSRSQLVTALVLALAAGAIPVAWCLQTGQWPAAVLPFVLLQAWLATASVLERRNQLNLRTKSAAPAANRSSS